MKLAKWKQWARSLKRDTYALYLAGRDPRVPWYARVLVVVIVAYALSPIDLIPDPIPVLGYLDDLVLVPLGVALAIRLIPPAILAECREEAVRLIDSGKPVSRIAAVVIVLLWIVFAALAALLVLRALR